MAWIFQNPIWMCFDWKMARRFDNSAAGFGSLKKWLNKLPVARVVFEATGPYHKAFEIALGERFALG